MSDFVLDASVALSWLLDDESDPRAEAALVALETTRALVPRLWHVETRNVLLIASRRGRLRPEDLARRIADLGLLPVETDDEPDLDRATALAVAHRLTLYDALYLELAARRGAGLASLDARLVAAARAEGVAAQ